MQHEFRPRHSARPQPTESRTDEFLDKHEDTILQLAFLLAAVCLGACIWASA